MKNIGRKEEIKAGREVAEAGRDIKAWEWVVHMISHNFNMQLTAL
jgi:hypothetical protein